MYQATFLKLSYWHLLHHILYHQYIFSDLYRVFDEGNTSRTFSQSPGHLREGLGVELMMLTSCIFQGFILTVSASMLCTFSSHYPFIHLVWESLLMLSLLLYVFIGCRCPGAGRGLQESLWGEAGAVPCQTQPVPASSNAHNSWA